MYKTFFSVMALSVLGLPAVWAQPHRGGGDPKIQQYRIAAFTEMLELTPEEAQGFWPVYNQYQANLEDIRKQQRPDKAIGSMTDQEAELQLKKHFEVRVREIDLEKKMVEDLRKVLPVQKIAKMPMAEREFRATMVRRVQEVRKMRG
jgi:hypothetical protein